MLDDKEFREYAKRLHLIKPALAVINRARHNPQLAGTTTGHGSMTGQFLSEKMDHSVNLDAKTTEGLGFRMYDWAEPVCEYWEQAVELKLVYTDLSGHRHGVRTRVDALVLEVDGVFLDDWMTEEELLKNARLMPSRYVRADGRWTSPPAEEAAARLGLTYRIRTPADVPAALAKNESFLRTYRRSSALVSTEAREALFATVNAKPGLTEAELLRESPAATADDLFLLIARDELYVNQARHHLAETFYTPVFPSAAFAFAITGRPGPKGPPDPPREPLLQPGSRVEMGGRELLVVGRSEVEITFRADGGALLPLSCEEAEERIRDGLIVAVGTEAQADELVRVHRTAKGSAWSKAEKRLLILRAWWAGKPVSTPPRTLRRWAKLYRDAALRCGNGLVGLVMGDAGRPAGSALEEALAKAIDERIASGWEIADPPTKQVFYAQVCQALVDQGLAPPGYETVVDRISLRDRVKAVRAQAGRKVAYQVKEFVSYLAFDTPRHGERPWEVAHVDHTEIDLYCVDSETGLPLGRPWLTLLIDAYSRRVLAFWLTFDEPSSRSVMMVLRRCVRRWGRLPEKIVVDDGAEFGSEIFEKFLLKFEIEKSVRRGNPRAGSVIERFFGTLNTRLWYALLGQTRPTKNVRSMSPEVDPRLRAVWTLATLNPVVEEFLERYENTIHPAFGATPRAVYDARMVLTGQRDLRLVAYDEIFFFATLPTTDKGYVKVSAEGGRVKINHRLYTAPELMSATLRGKLINVRFDPMDVRHAYAYVGGRWIELYCPSLRRFPPVSEREVAAISAEYDQRARRSNRAREDDSAELAIMLGRFKQSEKVLAQRRRDAEARAAGLESEMTPPGFAERSDMNPGDPFDPDPSLAPLPERAEPDAPGDVPDVTATPTAAPAPRPRPRLLVNEPPLEVLAPY